MKVFDRTLLAIMKFETLSIFDPISVEFLSKINYRRLILQYEVKGDLIYSIDSESFFQIFRLISEEVGIIKIVEFELPKPFKSFSLSPNGDKIFFSNPQIAQLVCLNITALDFTRDHSENIQNKRQLRLIYSQVFALSKVINPQNFMKCDKNGTLWIESDDSLYFVKTEA